MNTDLYWIPGPWRGRLAIIPRPRGGDWLEDEASGWRRAGVDTVVSLLEDEEAAQLDLLSESYAAGVNGIRFISFPIPDRGVPASAPAALLLMEDITDVLDQGKNVAVHCRQSIGRRFDRCRSSDHLGNESRASHRYRQFRTRIARAGDIRTA